MNVAQIIPFSWDQGETISFLLDAISVFTIVLLSLFFGLFAYRLFKLRKQRVLQDVRGTIEERVLAYLDGQQSRGELIESIIKNSFYIPLFVDICIDLLNSLEGEMEDRIKELLETTELQTYYKEKLYSGNNEKIVESLFFFKQCRQASPESIDAIYTLISSKNEHIAIAAALALIDSKHVDIQLRAFEKVCQRVDITGLAILEMMLYLSETDQDDFDKQGDRIVRMIKSPLIPFQNKTSLIISMGSVGFHAQAPELLDLLKGHFNRSEGPNVKFVCSIIEALGMLSYEQILKYFVILTENQNQELFISFAKASGSLATNDAIDLLHNIFQHSSKDVHRQAMIQLLKIDKLQVRKQIDSNEQTMPEIQRRTIAEIRERQENLRV